LVTFGSLVPSHGFDAISRSLTAARKMPETTPCTIPTVDEASESVMPFTQACTSLGRTDDRARSPSTGYTCRRSIVST
jgi:hypothetical protein